MWAYQEVGGEFSAGNGGPKHLLRTVGRVVSLLAGGADRLVHRRVGSASD